MPPRPAKSWSSTLRLPKSTFPPRAAPADQAQYLQRCTDDLYAKQRDDTTRVDSFVLNDGPPYANGGLHIGHALNKVLKDMVNRVNLQKGKRITYVPGWDCHGLPIEMKALEQHREKSPDGKINIDAVGIRRAARNLASKTVKEQMKGFREMAIMADWDNHWRTMDKGFEMKQLGVFLEMVKQGLIFRRYKPVYWSPSSGTALAEGELEYRDDHQSTAAYIKFPLTSIPPALSAKGLNPEKLYAVIWTTTPWTLPANKAIAIHTELEYSVIETGDEHLLLAKSRVPHIVEACGLGSPKIVLDTILGSELEGSTYLHPLTEFSSQPILHADFVSADSGSGLVHCAPGHGMDDYEVCLKFGISAFAPVDGNGCFTEEVVPKNPERLTGQSVLDGGSAAVLKLLDGHVLHVHKYVHKYPYDWRTKLPIIVRATAQWFADVGTIKDRAVEQLQSVRFIPETGQSRLESFIKGRSEWCISRQRAWGVPIPALYDANGNAVLTESSVSHIIRTIDERGIDAWWTDASDEPAWIEPSLDGIFTRGKDTMDVWFDSGTSWTQSDAQADVYLEGTDQHRGWFQSSLLTHISGSGRSTSPFKTLITHGFTLDQEGKKMSKSIGNTVVPSQILDGSLLPPIKRKGKAAGPPQKDALGSDALRLWVASSDYTRDVVIGEAVLKAVHSSLLKYRSLIKMLLGSIRESAFDNDLELTNLDYMALVQLEQVVAEVARSYGNYDFYKGINVLNRWLNIDVSAFYMEAMKDRLYCGDGSGVLHVVLIKLLEMLAPVTPVLIEEALEHSPQWFKQRLPHPATALTDVSGLIHIDTNKLESIKADLPWILRANSAIKTAQEEARASKLIGSSLQSSVVLALPSEAMAMFQRFTKELCDIFVVSGVELQPIEALNPEALSTSWRFNAEFETPTGAAIAWVLPPKQDKCPRCWRYVSTSEDELCRRCDEVVTAQDAVEN